MERFADAALMFWQSLDQREQRIIMFGLAYLIAFAASVAKARQHERDKRELAQMVAEELRHG